MLPTPAFPLLHFPRPHFQSLRPSANEYEGRGATKTTSCRRQRRRSLSGTRLSGRAPRRVVSLSPRTHADVRRRRRAGIYWPNQDSRVTLIRNIKPGLECSTFAPSRISAPSVRTLTWSKNSATLKPNLNQEQMSAIVVLGGGRQVSGSREGANVRSRHDWISEGQKKNNENSRFVQTTSVSVLIECCARFSDPEASVGKFDNFWSGMFYGLPGAQQTVSKALAVKKLVLNSVADTMYTVHLVKNLRFIMTYYRHAYGIICLMYNNLFCCNLFVGYTPWVKKQDTKLFPITSPRVNRCTKLFRYRLVCKFPTNLCLNIPPHLKCVATLPCETWMSENWRQSEMYCA